MTVEYHCISCGSRREVKITVEEIIRRRKNENDKLFDILHDICLELHSRTCKDADIGIRAGR